MTQPPEVRRCAKCGATAVLLETDWAHSTFGVKSSQRTLDFRCQGCGVRFRIRSKAHRLGTLIAGILLLPTCMGAPILGWAWWMHQQDPRNPVVPGAPLPPVRFAMGPPRRRCAACSGSCIAISVVANTHNGIPTGTDYTYRCTKCSHTFEIESPWGQVFNVMAALALGLIGLAVLIWAEGWGWRLGACVVGIGGALAWLYSGAKKLANVLRNPVDEALTL